MVVSPSSIRSGQAASDKRAVARADLLGIGAIDRRDRSPVGSGLASRSLEFSPQLPLVGGKGGKWSPLSCPPVAAVQ